MVNQLTMRGLGVVLLLVSVRRVTPDSIPPPGQDTTNTNSPVRSISSTSVSTPTAGNEAKKEVRMSKEEVNGGKNIMIKHFGESKVFVLLYIHCLYSF